jgi:hypothetical protein
MVPRMCNGILLQFQFPSDIDTLFLPPLTVYELTLTQLFTSAPMEPQMVNALPPVWLQTFQRPSQSTVGKQPLSARAPTIASSPSLTSLLLRKTPTSTSPPSTQQWPGFSTTPPPNCLQPLQSLSSSGIPKCNSAATSGLQKCTLLYNRSSPSSCGYSTSTTTATLSCGRAHTKKSPTSRQNTPLMRLSATRMSK